MTTDGDVDFEDKKLVHVDAPTNSTDAVNKSYVGGTVELFSKVCGKRGGSLNSQIYKKIYNTKFQMKIN